MKKDKLNGLMTVRSEGVFKVGKKYLIRVKNTNGNIISFKLFTDKIDAEECFNQHKEKGVDIKWK
jgi:hypothetical protein